MNKTNWYPGLRIGSKFVSTALDLNNEDLQDYIKSITSKYGLAIDTLENGNLSIDFQIHIFQGALWLNSGYFISRIEDEILVGYVEDQTIQGNPNDLLPGTYGIYLIPKKSNYEEGTIDLTNGSDIIQSNNANFSKLQPFDRIKIEDSALGNNGVYTVTSNITSNSVQITEPISGPNETNLKWKIVGYFGNNYISETNNNEFIYEYDDYTILLTQKNIDNAFKFYQVDVINQHFANLVDLRAQNLYVLKSISAVNADNVIKGYFKDITTIEEKAFAGNIPNYLKDILTNGILSGIGVILNNNLLNISNGFAIDGNGRLMYIPDVSINLDSLVSDGTIKEGKNYMYMTYNPPLSYRFTYSQQLLVSENLINIGKITYNKDVIPHFAYSDNKSYSKGAFSSIILKGKGSQSNEGEIYYLPLSAGTGQLHYLRLATSGTELEDIRLCNYGDLTTELDALNTSLMNYINAGDQANMITIGNVNSTLQQSIGALRSDMNAADLVLQNNINTGDQTLQNNINDLDTRISNMRIYETIRFSRFPTTDAEYSDLYLGWFTFNELPSPTIITRPFKVEKFTVAQIPNRERTTHETLGTWWETLQSPWAGGNAVDKAVYIDNGKIESVSNLNTVTYSSNSLLGVYFDGKAPKISLMINSSSQSLDIAHVTLGYSKQMSSFKIYLAEVIVSYSS